MHVTQIKVIIIYRNLIEIINQFFALFVFVRLIKKKIREEYHTRHIIHACCSFSFNAGARFTSRLDVLVNLCNASLRSWLIMFISLFASRASSQIQNLIHINFVPFLILHLAYLTNYSPRMIAKDLIMVSCHEFSACACNARTIRFILITQYKLKYFVRNFRLGHIWVRLIATKSPKLYFCVVPSGSY